MQSRQVNGFSESQVTAALLGRSVNNPEFRLRFERLNTDNQLSAETDNVLGGSIHHLSSGSIKRTADFTVRESSVTLDDYPDIIVEDGPLFYYRLGETSGTNANDSTANNFDGTYVGTPTLNSASLLPGDLTNGSVTLNGSSQYISNAHNAAFAVTNITLEGWASTTGTSGTLINRDNGSTQRQVNVAINSSGNIVVTLIFSGPVVGTYTATGPVNNGQSFHWAVVYDGAHVFVYVNSYRILKTAETRVLNSPSSLGFNIGRSQNGPGTFWTGTQDEVAVYARALSGGEIREHWQKGANDLAEFDFTRDRLKVYAAVKMESNGTDGTPWAEWPLGVFLLSGPDRDQTATGITRTVQGFDQTTILLQSAISSRYIVQAAQNYISTVTLVLQAAGLDTTGYQLTPTSLTLPVVREWPIGTSRLQIVNDLLRAIDYKPFRFDSNGLGVAEPYVLPESRAIDYAYATDADSAMTPDMKLSFNLFDVPNRVILSRTEPKTGTVSADVSNNNPLSPTSIPRREGREVVYVDQNYDAADQTTITAAANRILTEKSQVSQTWRFRTTLRPFHEDEDVLHLTDTTGRFNFDVDDNFIETEWTLPLDTVGLMEHVAQRIISVV